MTDWTIRLNAETLAIGFTSSRTALLVCDVCTKSAIIVSFFFFLVFQGPLTYQYTTYEGLVVT